ncbi:MAG: methylated-DNA-[protein]-cysteine S-methyltransferase [Saprospiraceae bacterium]
MIDRPVEQLDAYLLGDRNEFGIPQLMVGTEFQKSVWNALMKVTYGVTASYLQLAESVNNKNAARAVASENGANAISLFIPCHCIIGSNGDLVGYAGGFPAKKRLLKLEQDHHQR